jgi:hypothetical protein
MDITKISDLELAKIQGQLYQDFMRVQGNLVAVNQEIEKRTPKVDIPPKEPITKTEE